MKLAIFHNFHTISDNTKKELITDVTRTDYVIARNEAIPESSLTVSRLFYHN